VARPLPFLLWLSVSSWPLRKSGTTPAIRRVAVSPDSTPAFRQARDPGLLDRTALHRIDFSQKGQSLRPAVGNSGQAPLRGSPRARREASSARRPDAGRLSMRGREPRRIPAGTRSATSASYPSTNARGDCAHTLSTR